MIFVYQPLNDRFGVELGDWFRLSLTGRWGHPLNLYKPGSGNVWVEQKLSITAVNVMNRLLLRVVIAPSVEVFKGNLSAIM